MFALIYSCLVVLSTSAIRSDAMNVLDMFHKIPEDAVLNFTQLAVKYGRPCEEYDVVTEDGYILKVFHLTGNEGKKPVLIMHGLLDSADSFVLRGHNSTAINLANSGYDVWVGNVRGNKYTRRHVKLSPVMNKKEFWDFSFHEKGLYDLPAIIDFVIEETGKEKLAAIGHSQGTTIFYVMGSSKPEYNDKISLFISLAPVAHLNQVSPVLLRLITFYPVINAFFVGLKYEGVLQTESAVHELMQFLCTQKLVGYNVCAKGLVFTVDGNDSEELEPEFFEIVMRHFPAGASRKAFAHYVQLASSGIFAPYDYGVLRNQQVYNSTTPPAYDLSKVTMPIVLVTGKNDGFCGLKDVEKMKDELPNVLDFHIMEREKFNHADFVWAKNINVYLNPLIKKLLAKYT